MKYLSREAAFGKLKALADGAAIVRRELAREESTAARDWQLPRRFVFVSACPGS